MTPAHEHQWGSWNFCGSKHVIQVRSCSGCPATQTRRATNLDVELVAEHLSTAWKRYEELFREPPHGTKNQMRALLELAKMDDWGSIQNRNKSGGKKS